MKLPAAAATPAPGQLGRRDWTLAQWLAWQEQLHPSRIDLGLERVRRVALRLGLLPAPCATLTFAGTNGKGSSACLAASIYTAAGYGVGCYTSPHLLRYNERITIDGEEASDTALCTAFQAIDAARGDTSLTYFEFGTLAALSLFRHAGVAVQVLEVGLGGRLDAVNIVDADCAVVTSIGLDHIDLLGPDRESIGYEKGAVYRAGRLAVCVDRDPPASVVMAGRHSRFLRVGKEFDFQPGADGWQWSGPRARHEHLPLPALSGPVQLQNAAGVLAAVDALQGLRPVPPEALRAGLVQARLPGRLHRCGDLLLDVAHNAEAVAALCAYLQAQALVPRALVLGMMRNKPVEAVAGILAQLQAPAFCITLDPPRGLTAAALAARLAAGGLEAQPVADASAAIAAARACSDGAGPIVVCGSFKTVAAVFSATTKDMYPC